MSMQRSQRRHIAFVEILGLAPLSAKLIAVSSLFLWFAMITFGRYIQPLSNTVRLPGAAGPN